MFQSRKILRNQADLIEEIRHTNQLLQSIPDQIARKSGNVTIENLRIQQATLDKLLFQLDKIDVKELSGTLNLGNNFYTPDGQTKDAVGSSPDLRRLSHLTDSTAGDTPPASGDTGWTNPNEPGVTNGTNTSNAVEDTKRSPEDVQSTVHGYTVKLSQGLGGGLNVQR